MSLKGRTAIVTGATRGIGRAIVLKLAEEGANIAFNYAKNEELAKTLTEEIKGLGVEVQAYQVDIRDFDEVQKMKAAVLEKFGSFDILINNAGIIRDASLMMMKPEDWTDVIDTNLNGTFYMTKAVIVPFMKQKKGNIINITSISGVIGMARQTNYSSSKGGMIAFTKSLAKEVAPYNIRVNAIAPGFIETDMLKELNEDYLEQAKKMIPLGRLGQSDEVAEVVAFLLNDKAQYITGQVIQIDGGLGI